MNYSDRDLLAKTIQAEAGNQGAKGMMAVGNVIMNRLGKGGSLSDVILAPGQFSPWNSVTGYAGGAQGQDMAKVRPSEQAYKTADMLLSGGYEDITGGATHFYNPSISNPAWGRDKAGGDWQTIGSHIFGKAGGYRTGKGRTMEPTQQSAKQKGLLGFIQNVNEETGLTPFEQFAAALDPLIMPSMRMGETLRASGKERVTKSQQNKTIEWLKANGYPEIAAMVSQNPAVASNVMSAILSKKLSPADETSSMQNYKFLIAKGIPPEEALQRAFGKGGNTYLGSKMQVSGDKVIVEDPNSPAGVRFINIPGGKSDIEQQETTTRQTAQKEQQERKESVVSSSIDYLVGKLDKGGLFDLPEAGIYGNLLAKTGINQEAVSFRNELATVQASMAFDRLQQMREASKTGGALGSVSERELDLLISAYGNINQSTDPKRLRDNLIDIKRVMNKIENDPVASAFYYGRSGTAQPRTTSPTSPTAAPKSGGVKVGEPYGD